MTGQDDSPTIECRYTFFPARWDSAVSKRLFELLVGPDKIIPATRWGNEGKNKLPVDSGECVEWLADWYEASHKGNRIPLFADPSAGSFSFDLWRSEWGEHSSFGQLLFWPKRLDLSAPAQRVATADSLSALVEVAALTEAPLVSIDYRRGWGEEPITLASRRECKRVVQGTVHAKASMGPWRGLDRIPWRLILGRHIVATIGTERLSGLPAGRAIDHGNGLWSLQTTVDPAESITEVGRESERQIIDALGEQFFADTEAHELAKVPPSFPDEWVPDDSPLVERYGHRLKPL